MRRRVRRQNAGRRRFSSFLVVVACVYSAIRLIERWLAGDYSHCRYPMQLYMLGVYTFVLFYMFAPMLIPKVIRIQNPRTFKDKLQNLVLVPIFFVWTLLGTVFFFGGNHCMFAFYSEGLIFVAWIGFCYIWIGLKSLAVIKARFRDQQVRPLATIRLQLQQAPDYFQTGFAKHQLDQLDTSKVTPDMTTDNCSVCLCNFEVGNSVIELPICKHVFDTECIKPWLQTNNSCPLCRTVVSIGADPTTPQPQVAPAVVLVRVTPAPIPMPDTIPALTAEQGPVAI